MWVRGRAAVVAIVAVVLGLLAGCTGSSDHPAAHHAHSSSRSAIASRTGHPTRTVPRPTGPPALSVTAYRARLAAAGRVLQPTLLLLSSARPLPVLAARLHSARLAADRATSLLSGVVPPPSVHGEHVNIVAALRQFGTDLATMGGRVSGRQLCDAPVTLATLRTAAGNRELHSAGLALLRRGYHLPVVLPGPAVLPARPASGVFLRGGNGGANGQLSVENNGSADAVFSLVVGGAARTTVFVRAAGSAQVNGVPDGTYAVYYASGTDWDGSGFARGCDFSRFDAPLSFTTTNDGTFIHYSTWRLTLQPTIGGTATVSAVPPAAYPR